jgi:four helix bundle protein
MGFKGERENKGEAISCQLSAISSQQQNFSQVLVDTYSTMVPVQERRAMQDFHELKVWQKAHALTMAVYNETHVLPKDELYGLTSQLRRASSSIPANIAEGCGRSGDIEFARFLQISMGSASEFEYHLLLARDLGFINDVTHARLSEQVIEIKRMLVSFMKTLRGPKI